MALEMEDLTGDGKVLKKILRPGAGPVVPEKSMVRVHYNGYLEYCDEPYDSSRLRCKEQQFKVGQGASYYKRLFYYLKKNLSSNFFYPTA